MSQSGLESMINRDNRHDFDVCSYCGEPLTVLKTEYNEHGLCENSECVLIIEPL